MKRRTEEIVKQENTSSGGYCAPPRPRGNGSACVASDTAAATLSAHSNARILSSLAGSGVVQSFSPGPPKSTDHSGTIPGSIQYSSSTYNVSLQGSCASSSVKVHGCPNTTASSTSSPVVSSSTSPAHQFQRLKVEDALSYLDQVKFKFGNQPQVYNDFLDIMKEFKSQSIDTPGVIQRVSNLFKGHPELIVGFNTFLPPGYKIEVQSNDQGHSFQVSVSMPSPSSVTPTPASMVSHHLSIPASLASLGTPLGSSPVPPNVSQLGAPASKPVHSPGNSANTAAPPIMYQNATAMMSSEAAVSTAGSAPPAAPTSPIASHHHIPPSTSPLAAAAGYTSPVHGDHSMPQGQGQPVEFNHAINYVNKIKNRFQGQPDKYKKFLEILHTYQKEQHNMKEGHLPSGKHLTEAEVYSQVAKLFEHQDDLLAEFGQFLPDATSHQAALGSRISCGDHPSVAKKQIGMKQIYNTNPCGGRELSTATLDQRGGLGSNKYGHTAGQIKRTTPFPTSVSSSGVGASQPKKHKVATLRDVTITEAGKYANLSDFAFFDKVRKALKNMEAYENFVRCLILYNNLVISGSELVQLVTPFLEKFPELFRWFKKFVLQGEYTPSVPIPSSDTAQNNLLHQDRTSGEPMEIDYTTCNRLGASYCALPKNYIQPKCSGRTSLCKEVLNDTWVSFPTWSEDSTFVTSRKTQYEEYIYRCEDERFELDLVIETNSATIRVLEGVHKKLSRMSPDEVAKFRLDDCLGGSSPTIHVRAIKRIYGDKAPDIIDGLKKNPAIAVPVVLKRLKSKEEEWREAQKSFNKIWREQNEKYYLKSLDHQGKNFKDNDTKALRSRSLLNEIKSISGERYEKAVDGGGDLHAGPHLMLPYKNKCILDDAADLLIHHVKRQTGIHKEEKRQVKLLLRHLIPDMFFHPRQELSEDEREDEGKSRDGKDKVGSNTDQSHKVTNSEEVSDQDMGDVKKSDTSLPPHARTSNPDESYSLFYGNSYWYLFLRLHQILCERLAKMFERARIIAAEEASYRQERKESTAVALRLKPKNEFEVEEYYPAFLDMIKNVLDVNMDNNTFEDSLREMFGIHAYIAFTIDKVITSAVRQLQHLVTDEACLECVDLYHQEKKHGGAGGECKTAWLRLAAEQTYQRKAEKLLLGESCFKMVIYKHDCKLAVELLKTESDVSQAEGDQDEKWPAYGDGYVGGTTERVGGSQTSATVTASEIRDRDDDRMDLSAEDNDELDSETGSRQRRKPVFLPRNVRVWRRRSGHLGLLTDSAEDENKSVKKSFDMECSDIKISMRKEKSSSNEERDADSSESSRRNLMNRSDISAADSSSCSFNINQYHMVFVVNKENYLYRRQALQRAHQSHSAISTRLGLKFHRWHGGWVAANIMESQHKACSEWLMGRVEGFTPNRTRMMVNNDISRPPYRTYNRYCVEKKSVSSEE